jgi:hypothetical protein
MQAMGQHMDLGFFPRDDFTVHPDYAVALVKWNDGHLAYSQFDFYKTSAYMYW